MSPMRPRSTSTTLETSFFNLTAARTFETAGDIYAEPLRRSSEMTPPSTVSYSLLFDEHR